MLKTPTHAGSGTETSLVDLTPGVTPQGHLLYSGIKSILFYLSANSRHTMGKPHRRVMWGIPGHYGHSL